MSVLDWHPWFAWHPVETIDEELVWFKVVERRTVVDGEDYWFEYRLRRTR